MNGAAAHGGAERSGAATHGGAERSGSWVLTERSGNFSTAPNPWLCLSQEAAWLDMIDRRYQWLKRFLVAFEDRHGKLTGLSRLLNARRSDIDVKVLLYAIKRTIAFEELLGKRFDGGTLLPKTSTSPEKRKEPPRSPPGRGNPFLEEEEGEPDEGNPFAEDMVKERGASGAHPQPNPFEGIVSKCFEEHLGVYVESQDKNLHGLMDRFVTDLKQSGIQRMNGEDSTLLVTAGDLFLYYKKCLVQCSQLSTGQPMLDLVHVFQKFLRDYCQRILAANLPKASASLSRDLSTAGLLQNFQTLLKEGDLSLSQLGGATSSTRLSAEDIDRVCWTGLSRLLNARRSDIDVKVLLYAIKRTIAFEELLGKRFDGGTLLPKTSTPPEKRKEPPRSPPGRGNPFLEEEEGEPDDGNPFAEDMVKEGRASGAHPQPNPFEGIVSKCFEEHLGVYVESQDKNLHGLMDRFVTDLKQSGIQRMNGEDSTLLVTAGDLFLYYKKPRPGLVIAERVQLLYQELLNGSSRRCLVQCSQLSTGQPMLDLVHVFQKFLRDYCQRILAANLPKASASLSRDLSTAGLLQNFQTLLKEGDLSLSQLGGATSSTRLSAEDIDRVCCVLTASEYCLSTADQLEAKLKEKISRGLKDKVNLSPESDAFRKVISTCVALLVQDVQAGCETALATMNKISWQNVDTVGDCSPYVNAIGNHLNSIVPRIREGLTSSMKFFLEFCSHFVSSFIPRFLSHLYKCKPMSPVGAEQALLDAHMLKTTLLDLPSVGARIVRKPPASYTKIVSKGMGHVEMVLKVVMAANDPPKMLVEQFIACVKDGDAQEFQKCLEMMSIKKQDQAYCLELYKAQKAGGGPSVGLRGALLSPPSGATGPSGVTGAQSMAQAFLNPSSALDQLSLSPEGKIKKLEKLIRKGL
ncbi:unnamed protein product [Cyprideis torosa]|uniref:Vacuolar protein sorting-associated protein 53 homolog n=1 Tax=Cyprideis torosa TaxID=163714 RepID=A0A7R8WF96_9CRUS|nr:unnamed protein product [Cyprideis torosa]CAG0896755.1 unnamed protein product [Cyprideis torosa]